MNKSFINNLVEVLIFSSDTPLTVTQLKDLINEEKNESSVSVKIEHIEEAIKELMEKYNDNEYSYHIIRVAGGYRFATKKDYAHWLAKLNKEKQKRKLSQSALETLAIIAYNQPITKSEIEAIRGVNVDYIVGALLEKELITIKGRAQTLGRPMLYGITDTFLEYLGINSVADLPPLKAIEEVIKSGPPEGVTQSDIDFFEEINRMKNIAENDSDIESLLKLKGDTANQDNLQNDNLTVIPVQEADAELTSNEDSLHDDEPEQGSEDINEDR
jgi:segregation and condensation protein B